MLAAAPVQVVCRSGDTFLCSSRRAALCVSVLREGDHPGVRPRYGATLPDAIPAPPRLTPRFVWPSRDCRARTRDSPERATNPNLACRVFANSRAVRIPFRVPRNSTFRVPFNLPGTGDFPVPRNREFHVPRNPAVVSTPPQRGTTLSRHRA